ncbi:MAG: EscU/YscU/HrcU family type III secretion system export apparatus switch protein [Isosphaeraceae bacterium]
MSEDRTQAASPRRRQQARQRGLVARSPDLTSAVGLLAAVVLLGTCGGDLIAALVAAVREPLTEPMLDPTEVVGHLRHLAGTLAAPLGGIIGGVVVAMIAAHQVQTGGLWAPALLAPDLSRFSGGSGDDPGARIGRGVWSVVKAGVVVSVATWVIRADLPAYIHLASLDAANLTMASGVLLRRLAYALALASLPMGLVDFWLQYRRLEERLQMSSEEQREEQKAVDGDPAHRTRRRNQARKQQRNPTQTLEGAALVLTGPLGLAVVVTGEPPPGRIQVRETVRGLAGSALCRSADRAGISRVESAHLAQYLALARASGLPMPPDLAAELARIWPQRVDHE